MVDLGCHCVEIARNYIGKDIKPVEVMCWAATQVHPIKAEDSAIGLVKYANGAMGQFEVSWCFRGGMDLRDEVMGTEGTIWLNNFLLSLSVIGIYGLNGATARKVLLTLAVSLLFAAVAYVVRGQSVNCGNSAAQR